MKAFVAVLDKVFLVAICGIFVLGMGVCVVWLDRLVHRLWPW